MPSRHCLSRAFSHLSEINERRHIPAVPIKIIARAGKTETDVIDLDITLITRRRREDIDRMGIGSASLTLVYGVLHASPAARYFSLRAPWRNMGRALV